MRIYRTVARRDDAIVDPIFYEPAAVFGAEDPDDLGAGRQPHAGQPHRPEVHGHAGITGQPALELSQAVGAGQVGRQLHAEDRNALPGK